MSDDRNGANALVSVLMPCCGQLEYTRMSVPRVLRHSRQPFEVIFLDAGSLDGTREYLAGVAACAPVRVEVLRSGQEQGFAGLVEQAMLKAQGAFVAWVSNDVLVTELWLQHLMGLVTAHPAIGVVGPTANAAGEQQRVAQVPYRLARPRGQAISATEPALDTKDLDSYARSFREAHRGQWGQVERLDGFCWLARRAVFQHIDLGLKRGQDGVFDTGRFSIHARPGGGLVACCRDLFVHHFDSRPMIG